MHATLPHLFLISAAFLAASLPISYEDVIKTYYPILKEHQATEEESVTLLAIALYETNGYTDHKEFCKIGGCDGGIARGIWQIHCIDKPGKHWKYSRWKWWLQSKRPDIFSNSFGCNDLNIDKKKDALAALIVYRAYANTNKDPISIALLWHGIERSKVITDNRRKAINGLLAYVKRAVERKT